MIDTLPPFPRRPHLRYASYSYSYSSFYFPLGSTYFHVRATLHICFIALRGDGTICPRR
jgi:hypothetical protein